MERKERLARKIEVLRTDLESVIEEKKDFVDPEVIKASQSLDRAIIKHYRLAGVARLRILEEGVE